MAGGALMNDDYHTHRFVKDECAICHIPEEHILGPLEATLISILSAKNGWSETHYWRDAKGRLKIQGKEEFKYLQDREPINFSADLRLATIHAVNYGRRAIWSLASGFGKGVRGSEVEWDWSHIRDSKDEEVDAMFEVAKEMLLRGE